jgi:hypothetical protein
MNDQDILACTEQADQWLLGRRKRLEKHEEESATLLWLSVSEIEATIDSFDTLRNDLIHWIGGSDVAQSG